MLARCRFRLPLQATAPASLPGGAAYLMLLNPAGGLNGGDHAATDIDLNEGAQVCLSTPSATRVYRCPDAPAVQRTSIRIGSGAHLDYLPDHLIPHEGADLRQSVRIDIAAGGSCVFWDALAAGRVVRGELWRFRRIDSRVEVFHGGEALYIGRSLIVPGARDPARMAVMDDYGYTASLLALGDFDAAEASRSILGVCAAGSREGRGGRLVAASPLRRGGCVVRILTRSAIELAEAQSLCWNWVRGNVYGLPAIDLRKY